MTGKTNEPEVLLMSENVDGRTGRRAKYTGLCLIYGAGVGLVFGTPFGSTAIGLVIGAGVGLVIGAGLDARQKTRADQRPR